jgi:3-hydroxyisobutyryl-CoA hydrolase
VIIDKDNKPRWDPKRLQDVTEEKVKWYFSPLKPEQELKI